MDIELEIFNNYIRKIKFFEVVATKYNLIISVFIVVIPN